MRKSWLFSLGLLIALVSSAYAYRPMGWVYCNYPFIYDQNSGDWYWLNTSDTQWVATMKNGQWVTLPASSLASGWCDFRMPYAYSQNTDSWHYVNAGDTQWVVNMRTKVWSRLGDVTEPAGMVRIPAGTNAGTNPLAKEESYGHQYARDYSITVNAFRMDAVEVTKALWDQVYSWAILNGYSFDNAGLGKAADHPVHSVNWYDCIKWCNARSEKEGLAPVYRVNGEVYRTGRSKQVVQTPALGYRLPTVAEWEYAARGGGASRRFPWGDSITHDKANYRGSINVSYDGSSTKNFHPSYHDDVYPYTSPVGSFPANGYGLFDMVGNVWEWCFDWSLADTGLVRAFCGGSFSDYASGCWVGLRNGASPEADAASFGFRCVLSVDP